MGTTEPRVDADTMGAETEPRSGEDASAPTTIGRYRVLRKIGAGGMGVVYAAYDNELDRKIAVKLVARGAGKDGGGLRLVREAQAMARVSHPNVINVYDAGTFGRFVFVAMEYVDGHTLAERMAKRPGWREVLEVFRAAGRGLAGAHEAGLIHRDFKPENVMITRRGRVVVLDFGLARPRDATPETSPAARGPGDEPAPALTRSVGETTALEASLTRTGALMGTPAYMAPEQMRGQPLDARSDQFSFCVAAYEALYGARPFAGSSLVELYVAIERRQLRPPPRDAGIPAWVHRAVTRGLEHDAAARWPSMDALLEALERAPGARRRRLLWAGGGLAAALAAALVVARQPDGPTCDHAAERLAEIWDAPRKRELRAAFEATELNYAGDTWARVEPALDAYAGEWINMHEESCRATHVRGEQSSALLDLRMACLERRRALLAALVDQLAAVDEPLVRRAQQASADLPTIASCGDLETLTARVPPPADAEARAQLEALQGQLARVDALQRTGRIEPGLQLAEQTLEPARRLGYAPLLAEALVSLGSLQSHALSEDAEETLLQAIETAAAAGEDALAAEALTGLVTVIGNQRGRYAEAQTIARLARAAAVGAGGDPRLLARVEVEGSWLLYLMGKGREAAAATRALVESLETRWGPRHSSLERPLTLLGALASTDDEHDAALEYYARALEIARQTYGPNHPTTAAFIANVGTAQGARGDSEAALASFRDALARLEASLGPENMHVAMCYDNLGGVHYELGELASSRRDLQRALELKERLLGRDHPSLVGTLEHLGQTAAAQGSPDEALAYYERGLALAEASLGAEHPSVATLLVRRAGERVWRGAHAPAERDLQRALGIFSAARGEDHPDLREPLSALAWAQVEGGRDGEALVHIERALQLPGGRAAQRARQDAWLRLLRARADAGAGGSTTLSSADLHALEGSPDQRARAMVSAWLAGELAPRARARQEASDASDRRG